MTECKNYFDELLNGSDEEETIGQIISEDEIPMLQPTEQVSKS